MMFKLGNLLIVTVLTLLALMGCEVGSDMEAVPVKLVGLINYPVGGKDAYIAWAASVAPIMQAPDELKRVAAYENIRGENPHRLVEFEFDSFADSAKYLNRPEIAAILQSLPDYSSDASAYLFVQRGDYSKDETGSRRIKLVDLIDYPLGGKAAYLKWVASIAEGTQKSTLMNRTASYDNYYGVSPHRLVEFEFDSLEDVHSYQASESSLAASAELPNRAGRSVELIFELHSDYVNE